MLSLLLSLKSDHRKKQFESDQHRHEAEDAIKKLQEQIMVNSISVGLSVCVCLSVFVCPSVRLAKTYLQRSATIDIVLPKSYLTYPILGHLCSFINIKKLPSPIS